MDRSIKFAVSIPQSEFEALEQYRGVGKQRMGID
jgi:hypothetical protein